MIEIIKNHWDDPDSKKIIKKIFMDTKDNPDPKILGQCAKALAMHGEDIGDELLRRYPAADPQAKLNYAVALAYLNKKEAIPLLIDDLDKIYNPDLKSSIIKSLGKLSPDDTDTIIALKKVINSASVSRGEKQTIKDATAIEVLSMHAVHALSQSHKPQNFHDFVIIASDGSLPVDVRLGAVESLQKSPADIAPEIIDNLEGLKKIIQKSETLDEIDKDRFSRLIRNVEKKLSNK